MDEKIAPKHDHAQLKFPGGFLWGTTTSAHQVEGNNVNSDWWDWELKNQPPEKRSGLADNQYELYNSDFELAKSLSHNAHRLSIEWSRIEPEEGKFNQEAIDHYIKVLKSLKKLNLTVMLTLHHFTSPLWFAQKGGWEAFKAPFYFERFVKKIVPELKDYVDLWITINEPSIYTYAAYVSGEFPPQKRSWFSAFKVMWNFAQGHKKAYKAIHQLTPNTKVGLADSIISFDAFHHHSPLESLAEWFFDVLGNHSIYILTGMKTHDFLGINYYFNSYISFNGESRLPAAMDISRTTKEVSDMGWEIYPEGIFDVLMDFSDYHKPVYITENGIATTNDDRRVRFLLSYLQEVYHAIQNGVDVRGYFHWSFMDNFEWAHGFTPKFGLVEVNYLTQERTLKPSALVYKEIIKYNGIKHYLLKLLGHGIKVEEVLDHPKDLGL